MIKKIIVILTCFFSFIALADSTQSQYNSMMNAIEKGDIDTVDMLISKEIDLNMREDSRASPTFATSSAYLGKTKILEKLLNAGADIESLNGDGYTPLMMAVFGKQEETIMFLLSKGADVNAVGFRGETTNSLANGDPEIAKLLSNTASKK